MRAGHVGCEFGPTGPPASLSFVVRPHSRAFMKLPLTNLVMFLFAGVCAVYSLVRAVISFRIDKNVPTGVVRSFVALGFASMATYLVLQPQPFPAAVAWPSLAVLIFMVYQLVRRATVRKSVVLEDTNRSRRRK